MTSGMFARAVARGRAAAAHAFTYVLQHTLEQTWREARRAPCGCCLAVSSCFVVVVVAATLQSLLGQVCAGPRADSRGPCDDATLTLCICMCVRFGVACGVTARLLGGARSRLHEEDAAMTRLPRVVCVRVCVCVCVCV